MARKPASDETVADIQDIPLPSTGGFANVPPPPQQIIDQLAASQPVSSDGPVMTLGKPLNREAARAVQQPPQPSYAAPVHGKRPAQEIINAFFAEMAAHPDFMVLSSSIGGKPEKNTEFPNTPRLNQHKGEIRFVWRDPQPQVEQREQAVQRSAYEPGGKYFGLIERKGEDRPEPEAANEGGVKVWGHLIKQRETDVRDVANRETVGAT
jgi:hypothetical protein